MTHRVAVLNYKFEKKDHRDFKLKLTIPADLPQNVDLRKSGFAPAPLDQGELGACVSNGTSNALKFCLAKERAYTFQPCRLFIYYNARELAGYDINEDSGLQIRDACKALSKYFAPDERNWPYVISKFAIKPPEYAYINAAKHKSLHYLSVSQDLDSIRAALAAGYPIVFGILAYDSLISEEVARTGMIPQPNTDVEKIIGGHCIVLYGYDMRTQVFLIQNSWGTSWGTEGYATIPFSYVLDPNLASDFWTYDLFK